MAKLLSGSLGGTHRSSLQKKCAHRSPPTRSLAKFATAAKKRRAIRPPDSATQYGALPPSTESSCLSHWLATVLASSSSSGNEISSYLLIPIRLPPNSAPASNRQRPP